MAAISELLSSLPYFHNLTAGELEDVSRAASELSFAKGEVLFLEGEPCRGLYVVKSGQIRVYKSSLEGREQVLTTAGPADSFNDVPVFDAGPNPASASAAVDSTVYLVPRDAVLMPMRSCPTAEAVLRLFATRLRYLTKVVEDLSFRTVIGRLAKLLLDMAVEEGGPYAVRRLTQDEMAAMVGSVRDVIGRALKQMEREGAIRIKGRRIMVINQDKLRAMT